MEEYQYKADGQTITVLAGTAAGTTKEVQISVDESYDDIVGIEAHEISDGGSPYYKIGFKDKDMQPVELVHKNAIRTDHTVIQTGKMRPINAPIVTGRKFTIQVYNDLLLATDLRFDIVLTLRRKVTPTR